MEGRLKLSLPVADGTLLAAPAFQAVSHSTPEMAESPLPSPIFLWTPARVPETSSVHFSLLLSSGSTIKMEMCNYWTKLKTIS